MNREFCKLYIPLTWTVTAIALLLSPCSHAAEWKITPSVDLSETYTDNVSLASTSAGNSDFVTSVSPGIAVTGTGSRLKVKIGYTMQNLAYSNESSKITTNHQLNADGNAELVEHLFFLDGKAGVSQQNISLFGSQPTDNTYITGNRASVATYSLSPYLRHRFDSIATSELRYTHDEVQTNVGGLSNSKGDGVLFNLSSGPAFSKLGWGLHYNKHKFDYSSNTPSVETESYSGDLRLMITPKFSLTATKGYEKNNYLSTTGTQPEGDSWTAGFVWTPTARTSLQASTGHRFFGKTHSLAASLRSRNTVWSVNYSEDITSTRSQFLIPATISTSSFLNQLWASSIPDPVLRQQIVDSFIQQTGLPASLADSINYFTNRFFLQKQFQASVAINSAKSTLILSAVNLLREAQTAQGMDSLLFGTGSLALNDSTKQIGGNAVWNWRLTSRTNFNASVGYTKSRSISTDTTNNNRTMGLGLTKQFRPKLSGSVNLRHNQMDTNQSSGSYRENSIAATLHMTF